VVKMKMRDYSPWIREAWATWEVLRKLGFAADTIFWEFAKSVNAVPRPGFALHIVLRTQDRVATITCSESLSTEEARPLFEAAQRFQAQLVAGDFDEAEMHDVLHSSYVWTNKVDLLAMLSAKGFKWPFKLN
jgi:hypothetical protein